VSAETIPYAITRRPTGRSWFPTRTWTGPLPA